MSRPTMNPGQCAARLLAVISAAAYLAEDIEQATAERALGLATALQCVLQTAEELAADLDQSLTDKTMAATAGGAQ